MTTIYITNHDVVLPKRHEHDHYATEPNLIKAAMLHYAPPTSRAVLDIGAGDGRWGSIARQWTKATTLVGVEIQDMSAPLDYTGWYSKQDFLTWDMKGTFDFIVSNPPYYCAEQIIRKAWDMLEPGGRMIMLLRLAFMAGVDRYNHLWKEITPFEAGVLSRRPSFYDRKTSGTDYGLFVWRKNMFGEPAGMCREWVTKLIYYDRDDICTN